MRLYRASPESFFAAHDMKIKELESHIAGVQSQIKSVIEIAEAFIHNLPSLTAEVQAPTIWTYQVLLPNLYFDDIFEPELDPDPFRWVGASGRLAWALRLPRIAQYDFAIKCARFGSEAMRQTFRLKVNGVAYPWLATADGLYRTIILEAPDEKELALELSVDPATREPNADVTFSFTRIDIQRRG